MIKNVKNIHIANNFLNTDYNLIEVKNDKEYLSNLNFIYGKNGSGKTTLSNAIQAYKDNKKNKCTINFLNESNDEIKIDSDNIFVFNQNFIDNNIKFKDNGLKPIILIGKDVGIQNEIDIIKKRIKEYEKELMSLNVKKKEFQNLLESYNKTVTNKLKVNWLDREKEITGKKNISIDDSIKETIYKKNVYINNSKIIRDNIENEYNNLLFKYSQMKESGKCEEVDIIDIKKYNESNIQALLKKEIKITVLPSKDDVISKNIDELYLESNIYNKEFLENENFSKLVNIIYDNNLFNHISELHNAKLNEINSDYLQIGLLYVNGSLYARIVGNISRCNSLIKKYNEYIDMKIKNIFTPIVDCELDLYTNIENINKSITELNEHIKLRNKDIEKKNFYESELQDLSNTIAAFEIKNIYDDMVNIKEELYKIDDGIIDLIYLRDSYEKNIKELINKQGGIDVAIENINIMLKYILLNNCLYITNENNQYVLKSKGKDVQPSDISTGEINILALCYFFTLITEKTEEDQLYSKEILVVIDDPISSFDLNNKIGIITFLVRQINEIINGNKNSKILLFSHELYTIISLSNKDNYNIEFNSYIISDFKLEKKDISRYNTYKELFNQVYDYASDINDIDEMYIGNTMRKVLEAFSTFIFNTGINSVMKNKNLLKDKLKNKLDYFFYSMHRLVLNNESHTENAIKQIDNLFYQNSEEEKKKVAKDIICFIYLVSSIHVKSILTDYKKIYNINEWIKKIDEIVNTRL